MGSKFFGLFVFVTLYAGRSLAQEALNAASPLTLPSPAAPAAGSIVSTIAAARSAHELGLPGVAVTLYKELLAAPGFSESRADLNLALVTAMLDDGDVAGAEEVLQTFPGVHGSAWHLRMGLIFGFQKKLDAGKAEFAEVKVAELEPSDRSWWYFLQGMLANIVNDSGTSLRNYQLAEDNATNPMARARFTLAQAVTRLKLGTVRDVDLENARKNVDNFQGKAIGYGFVKDYAIMLDAFGQKAKAIGELQRQLRSLPAQEHTAADDYSLLLGEIAGPEEGIGREALNQLLQTGRDPEKQRIALQLLASSSLRGPARPDFRKQLDDLIGGKTPPKILEDLLLVRARVALAEKSYEAAVNDANELLQKFPGSQLISSAYEVRTSAAWEQRRYSQVVGFAEKARDELPPGQTHAELGVLVAEAWYRSGDFRSAAEAYGAALEEVPAGVSRGSLLFQRVQSEIEAARVDPAQTATRLLAVQQVIDTLTSDPSFDVVNRWQAEWNFARAAMAAGLTDAAAARVDKLLTGMSATDPALTPELRVRMGWLRARLAFEAGHPEQALTYADGLLTSPMETLDPALRAIARSELMLLKAQADLALSHPEAAVEVMQALRRDFPKSDAAANSYISQAEYYVKQDQLVEAQKLLTSLAEDVNLKDNANAPYALFRAAQLAETLGQIDPAIRLIEKLVTSYPKSDLVFTARMLQGDLLRKINQFAQAQLTYETIIAAYPQHLGIPAAQLFLADTHSAQAQPDQAVADPSRHLQRAAEIYESLLARSGISADLRIEAGYKLGHNLQLQKNLNRAQQVWWRDVANAFLVDQPTRANELGTGNYWIGRSLLDLGDMLESMGKLDDAKAAWELMVKSNLPWGQDLALARLAPYNISLGERAKR